MFRFQVPARSRRSPPGRAAVFGISCLLLGSSLAVSPPSIAKRHAPAASAPATAAAQKPDPEALLIEVYKAIGANRLRDAEAKADALVQAYPNFRLGHLIRGDLHLMHTRPVTTFGAVNSPGGPDDKLKNLREEAMVRLKSLRERPDPDLVPRAILQLREDQKRALVVDAKRSRLYVYENQGGQLRLVTDYYVSQGKYGVNKVKAGDQRTPIGVYYITSRLPGARLPDFYGTGALPLNYPNEWDKLNGRSGSGIWLHGTPSDSYSRPPLSSDGCVVLTNPDLNKLYNSVEPGKTPVVISDRVEFVNKTKWNNDRSVAAKVVDEWRRDFESMNMPKLLENYSNRFKSERGDDVVSWVARQQKPYKGIRNLTISLRDMTLFLYPGRDDLIVSTFTEEATAGKFRGMVRKRQYWAKEGARWKIVSEANL
ncbi:MAG TPA: L,D-transpeptidase family protein [Paucimonas sp.]|nr:L,D-transpeptidase family protein [Paucimonas sp.]